jgi:hypothetical protein
MTARDRFGFPDAVEFGSAQQTLFVAIRLKSDCVFSSIGTAGLSDIDPPRFSKLCTRTPDFRSGHLGVEVDSLDRAHDREGDHGQ